jgi:hypothetical protein
VTLNITDLEIAWARRYVELHDALKAYVSVLESLNGYDLSNEHWERCRNLLKEFDALECDPLILKRAKP